MVRVGGYIGEQTDRFKFRASRLHLCAEGGVLGFDGAEFGQQFRYYAVSPAVWIGGVLIENRPPFRRHARHHGEHDHALRPCAPNTYTAILAFGTGLPQ